MTTKSGTTALILRLGVLAVCLGAPQFAAAQDAPKPDSPKPADATPPAPDPDKVTLNFFKGTEVGGLVDTYYLYNSTKTAPLFHAFDSKQNSFDVSMAEIWLAKAPSSDSPIGYKIRMNFGSAPDLMAALPGESSYKNIEEAYGSYLAPVGKGLQIDVGKFVTNAGAEVIEAKDDWNYSRSLLFQLAIPLYHAGVRLTYSPSDKVTLMGGVVNGWNDVNDNNTGKTVMASVTVKPTGALSIVENYIGGPEQPANNSNWRTLSDTVVSYTVNPVVSLMANYDYGRDTNSLNGASVTWQGVAGYAKIQANKWVAIVPRVEYYNDPDGFTTGTVQHLTDGTLTLEIKPADNFMWRIEYRGDFSNQSPFTDSAGAAKKNQQMIEFGMLYSFSSKS
ncbi:MAG TPA: porin [Vicinamibacterales bacterium]|nr:porin [Vicinamibacterales bacterium]